MFEKRFGHKPCEWWGWWLRYPVYNVRRVCRNRLLERSTR